MIPDKESLDAVLQAAEWFLRNESEPLNESEKAEFLAWLKASPLHVREYLAVARTSHHLPAAIKRHMAHTPTSDERLEELLHEPTSMSSDLPNRRDWSALVEELSLLRKYNKHGS